MSDENPNNLNIFPTDAKRLECARDDLTYVVNEGEAAGVAKGELLVAVGIVDKYAKLLADEYRSGGDTDD